MPASAASVSSLTISIITPSFNYERFIVDCLDSVRLQVADEVAVQHVVIDDGSCDRSWEVICAQHEGASTDRVRQDNVGLAATLNRALEQVTGEWVLWLNADDFLLPQTLELFARAISEVPDAKLIFGDTLFVDDAARVVRLVAQPSFKRALFEGGYNSFHVPSVLWSRELLGEGRLDESMKLLMDLDLWLRLTPPGTVVAKIDAPLAAFRRHTGQTSASSRPSDAQEMRSLARRHGMQGLLAASSSAPLPSARVRHGLLKLQEGAWLRELHVMSHRGERVDWMRGGAEVAQALVAPTPRIRRSVSQGSRRSATSA